jgi:hypothetical protein
MTELTELKKNLIQFTYDRTEHEHDELSETWKLLDSKAQASAGIAGVFVAASFAFVRNTALQIDVTEKWLLSLALIMLAASIFSAVVAMLIRSVAMPLSGSDTAISVGDILKQPESELAERQNNLIVDVVIQWANVNARIKELLIKKGRRVEFSQASLVGASVIITTMTLYAIYCAH